MKKIALLGLLLLAGCEKRMSLDEQIDATKKCNASGGMASMSVNLLFQNYITCYPGK